MEKLARVLHSRARRHFDMYQGLVASGYRVLARTGPVYIHDDTAPELRTLMLDWLHAELAKLARKHEAKVEV